MDRTSAEHLMSAALALDGPLGELDSAISGIAEEQERAIFIEALGNVFRLINEGFVRPVARAYPELAPKDG